MYSHDHTPGRVLVADDDPLIRRLLAKIVAREGLIADTAQDGAEAIGMLEEIRYDALLLDLMMPRLNGFDVVDFLKEQPQRPIVIVVTAYGDDEWHDLDPRVVSGVVRKPFEVRELGKIIDLSIRRKLTQLNAAEVPSFRALTQDG